MEIDFKIVPNTTPGLPGAAYFKTNDPTIVYPVTIQLTWDGGGKTFELTDNTETYVNGIPVGAFQGEGHDSSPTPQNWYTGGDIIMYVLMPKKTTHLANFE